jgi:hypothetical protein
VRSRAKINGEFFSTLDQLDTDQTGDLRDHLGLRIDGGNMVLRDAKIHQGRLPTDPARPVPA